MVKKPKLTVAQYLEQQIAISDKSQKEIAKEVGYERPNVLTMIKLGDTKLPLNKIGLMAKALNVDPVHLLRLALSEYMPDTWTTLETLLGTQLVTDSEMVLVRTVRDIADGFEVDFDDPSVRKAVAEAIKPVIDRQRKEIERNSGKTRRNAA